MVVGAAALDHVTTPEHLEEEFKCGSRARRLCDRELMLDLPAESAHAVANHGDREAAFAVDESDDPLLNTWPFLLIARTGRIVTGHATTLRRGCDKNSVPPDARGFQHLASCTRRVTASRGNTQARLGFIHLRHSCYSGIRLVAGPWSGHFCLTPRVATGIGLSHHTLLACARRTVSEDPAPAVSC